MDMSEEQSYARVDREKVAPQDRENRFASLRSRNALGHVRKKGHFMWELTGKMPRPRTGQSFCASLRSRNAHGEMSQEQEFSSKCRALRLGQPFWASLRNRNAHGHVRRAVFCKNAQVKCRRPRSRKTRAAEFVRACAIETHFTWTCHKNKFIQQFTGKKTEPRWSDGAPRSSTGLNSHRKSPLVWTHCLGNKMSLQHPAASCSILQHPAAPARWLIVLLMWTNGHIVKMTYGPMHNFCAKENPWNTK